MASLGSSPESVGPEWAELLRLPGVKAAESTRFALVNLRHGHRVERVQIRGYATEAELYRVVDIDNRVLPLTGDGVVMTDRLARKLGLQVGDLVQAEVLEGATRTLALRVEQLIPEMMGLNLYMRREALNRALGEGDIANGFVQDVESYHYIRLIAGFGLAGELGAAITLVSETLPKEARGYGTAIVASVGVSGAIFAGAIGTHVYWRTAYFIGGGLGFALLLLRVGFGESSMFTHTKESSVSRGNFFALLWPRERLGRYLSCILIGVPVWYVIGVLVSLSQDVFVPELHIDTSALDEASLRKINGKAIEYAYIGLSIGDLISGILSQVMRSRKKVILIGVLAALVLRIAFALVVTQLMQIVGLIFVGGLLLIWVAWKMWREIRATAAHAKHDIPAVDSSPLGRALGRTLLGGGLLLLAWSFAVDVAWLARRR